MSRQKKPSSRTVYKRLMRYVIPYWRMFVGSTVGFALYASTDAALALLTGQILDHFNTKNFDALRWLPLLFVLLYLVRGVGAFLGNYSLARISGNVVHKLRCEIFSHYTRLSVPYFDTNNTGFMIARITNNIGEVTRATTDSVRTVVREGMSSVALFGVLIHTNWKLSLVFVAIAPIVGVMVKYVGGRMKRLSRNMMDSVGDLTQLTSEVVTGNRVVKGFGGEAFERQRFNQCSRQSRGQYRKLIMTVSINNPVMQLILSIAISGMMYLAILMMENATVGELGSFFVAALMLPKPIRQLSDANSEILRGIAAAESLFEVLDEPAERDDGDYSVARSQGRIEFKNLSFTYAGSETPALNNLNLTIEPGQTVALVGASGGGKSTLINLLPRFYDYQQGEILLDGVDIKRYQLKCLREQMAIVTQQVTLFNTTVANNIAYGALQNSSRTEIERAAADAYALDFIQAMERGMDTEIGENGVKLSGGQRQRLAIARALLKDAPILILDEATSALDNESERYIQQALSRVMQGRTTLVVAHRLSTIENADVILVMEQGQIVEQGSHAELLAKQGSYARLYHRQFETTTDESVD